MTADTLPPSRGSAVIKALALAIGLILGALLMAWKEGWLP